MLQIQIASVGGARKKIKLLRDNLSPTAILKVMALRMVAYVTESFETQGRGKWKPLAQSTLMTRRRGGAMALQDTGEYRKSWTGQPGGPNVKTDGTSYVTVGTEMQPLADWMEYGTKRFVINTSKRTLAARLRGGGYLVFGKSVNHPGVPARPVLPKETEARRILKETLDAMVQKVIEDAQKPLGGI